MSKIKNGKAYQSKEGYECSLVIYFSPPSQWQVRIITDGSNDGLYIGKLCDSIEDADFHRDKIAEYLGFKELIE